MPEPIHPPFNVTQPRQLDRWLDVNAQNGALTRTRGYVLLPTFNIPSAGRTYSEIVGVFNYAATNNFSLKNYNLLSNNGSYSLCIAYANSDLSVVRYVLVKGATDNNLSYPPMYAGQLIKKNFRLEIWDGTAHLNCVEANGIQIFSTVLGTLDYRYGLDFVLGNSSVLCTSQNTTSASNFFIFAPRPDILSVWLENHPQQQNVILDGSNNVITWTNRNGTGNPTQGTPANRPPFVPDTISGNQFYLEFIGNDNLSAPLSSNIQHYFVLLTPNFGGINNHRFLQFIDSGSHNTEILGSLDGTGIIFNISSLGFVELNYANLPSGVILLIEVITPTLAINIYDGATGILKSSLGPGGASFTLTTPNINLGDSIGAADTKGCLIYDVLGYTTTLTGNDRALALQYMFAAAKSLTNFNAPLSFAPCTVLTPNT